MKLASTEKHEVETARALSRSAIWRVQRHFFEKKGMAAWGEGIVPSYITTNPYIADSYAQVLAGYLRDVADGGFDPREPFFIIELGAGAGRLGFHLVHKLREAKTLAGLDHVDVRCVLTDLAESNLEFWELHPSLEPLVRAGLIDFARFDAEHPAPLELRHSHRVLSPGAVANPVALVANYFFDSIPQDAYYVEKGRLFESLLELASDRPEPDLDDPELFRRVNLIYHREPLHSPAYNEPEIDALLESYRGELDGTALDFPNVALRTLQFMRQLSSDRLLLLSADKGYHRAEDLAGRQEPGYAVHGSFSMMVNYHALGRYIANAGGVMLMPAYRYWGVDIVAMLLGESAGAFRETRRAYREFIDKRSPDDLVNLAMAVEAHVDSASFEQIMALLRMTGYDSRIFQRAFARLLSLAVELGERERGELRAAIERLYENYYYVGEESDSLFNFGMLLHHLGDDAAAVNYFDRSLELFGAVPSTYYNKAACLYKLGQRENALAAARAALALNPEMEQAIKLDARVRSDLERAARSPAS